MKWQNDFKYCKVGNLLISLLWSAVTDKNTFYNFFVLLTKKPTSFKIFNTLSAFCYFFQFQCTSVFITLFIFAYLLEIFSTSSDILYFPRFQNEDSIKNVLVFRSFLLPKFSILVNIFRLLGQHKNVYLMQAIVTSTVFCTCPKYSILVRYFLYLLKIFILVEKFSYFPRFQNEVCKWSSP